MSSTKKIVVNYYDSHWSQNRRRNVELYVPSHFVEGQIMTAFKKKIGYSHAHFVRDIRVEERR